MNERACGYCQNSKCEDFIKGVFLLNHGDTFYCPRCHELGTVNAERIVDGGTVHGVYKTVRVHFDYDPASKRHRQIAIVDIPELRTGGQYELFSALIKLEKRALQVAEVIIAGLNSGIIKDSVAHGIKVDIGRSDWPEQIERLDRVLSERERRVTYALQQV